MITIVTQMVVDQSDPAFGNPTKPIGPFYSEEDANIISAEKHYIMKEDAGRGWRRVRSVSDPPPYVEIDSIKRLWDSTIVIFAGGGGIPVVEHEDGSFEGVAAVIDKDYAAELLAEQVGVDTLLILTEVEKVAINYNRPDQRIWTACRLRKRSDTSQKDILHQEHAPKGAGGCEICQIRRGRKAIITSLFKAVDALEGKTGTHITA